VSLFRLRGATAGEDESDITQHFIGNGVPKCSTYFVVLVVSTMDNVLFSGTLQFKSDLFCVALRDFEAPLGVATDLDRSRNFIENSCLEAVADPSYGSSFIRLYGKTGTSKEQGRSMSSMRSGVETCAGHRGLTLTCMYCFERHGIDTESRTVYSWHNSLCASFLEGFEDAKSREIISFEAH
jgi:hypothetical protein